MFNCKKDCGKCCQNIGHVEELNDFHNGDGICFYYDRTNKMCTIYDMRPLICRVDEYYEAHLKDVLPLEYWYRLNEEACDKLEDKI
jgi:uncharacterized protein